MSYQPKYCSHCGKRACDIIFENPDGTLREFLFCDCIQERLAKLEEKLDPKPKQWSLMFEDLDGFLFEMETFRTKEEAEKAMREKPEPAYGTHFVRKFKKRWY